jgi:GTP-binding protein HflX
VKRSSRPDRRLINHRIKLLTERLADVTRARARSSGRPTRAFRALTRWVHERGQVLDPAAGCRAHVISSRIDSSPRSIPLTRDVELGENNHVLLTDTVGFIRKLPHHLVASFRATLEKCAIAICCSTSSTQSSAVGGAALVVEWRAR